MIKEYPHNIENCEWVCIFTVYYMNYRNARSYSPPWGYDIVGLVITDELIENAKQKFINDDVRELLMKNVVHFENNGGLEKLKGRKILSFRREISVEEDDLGVDFSVCVEKTEQQLADEKTKVDQREYEQYLKLKEKFEGRNETP